MKHLIYSSIILLLFSGCSIFDNSDDIQDFGIKTDHILIEGSEQTPLNRNRNYLNVEFATDLGLDAMNRLLGKYNLSFVNPSINPAEYNYKTIVRVRNKPAEDFYTNYGSSISDRFGNDPGIVFALPVYDFEDGSKMFLTNQILVSFDESLSEERKSQLLDSLKIADHLTHIERQWLGDLYLLQVDKSSPMNSLDLSNHYEVLDFIRHANPNFGMSIIRHH